MFTNRNEMNTIITPPYNDTHHGWISNNGIPTENVLRREDHNAVVNGSEIAIERVDQLVVENIYGIETKQVKADRDTDGELIVLKMPSD